VRIQSSILLLLKKAGICASITLFALMFLFDSFYLGYAQNSTSKTNFGIIVNNKSGKVPVSPLIPAEIMDVYFPEGKNYVVPEDSRIARYVKKAKEYESENNHGAAARYYITAYKRIKNSAMAPFLMFKYASLQSNIRISINALKSLIDEYPDFSLINGARFYLAEKLYLTRNYTEAGIYLKDIIEDEKKGGNIFTPFALRFLGILSVKDEKWGNAEEYFKNSIILILESRTPEYRYYLLKDYIDLSLCYTAKGERDKAERILLTVYKMSDFEDVRIEALYRLFEMYKNGGKEDLSSKVAGVLITDYPSSLYANQLKKDYSQDLSDKGTVELLDSIYDSSIFEKSFLEKLEGKIGIENTDKPTSEGMGKVESGFMIQLGSFKNEENANKLAEKLKRMGYNPIIVTAIINGETVIRVRIGYFSSRGEAERELATLNNKGYSGFIIGK